jgi:hypothetical protein
MTKVRIFTVILVFFITLSLAGCAIGVIAAGVGAARAGSAKKMEAESKNRTAYNQYLAEMHKNNIQREKAKLPAEPVLSFKEYMGDK